MSVKLSASNNPVILLVQMWLWCDIELLLVHSKGQWGMMPVYTYVCVFDLATVINWHERPHVTEPVSKLGGFFYIVLGEFFNDFLLDTHKMCNFNRQHCVVHIKYIWFQKSSEYQFIKLVTYVDLTWKLIKCMYKYLIRNQCLPLRFFLTFLSFEVACILLWPHYYIKLSTLLSLM